MLYTRLLQKYIATKRTKKDIIHERQNRRKIKRQHSLKKNINVITKTKEINAFQLGR